MGAKTKPHSHTTDGVNYLDLAGEAMLAGLTREQVIAQLVSRIRRDEGYLAYRRASGRRTRYDDQVTSDLRALALAAALLGDGGNMPSADSPLKVSTARTAVPADPARTPRRRGGPTRT